MPLSSERSYAVREGLDGMQLDEVCRWLLSSYWARTLSPNEIRRSIENSTVVFGAFDGDLQVGFLRVVSDKVRLAYLADVWVTEQHRRLGVATRLVQFALDHPELRTVSRWMLSTADQHEFYARFGFTALPQPDRLMVRNRVA
jgi:predicted N-acetyltransferase YhbS